MTWTIESLIQSKMSVAAFCQNADCEHHKLLDLEELIEKLGPNAPAMADDLKPKLRCEKCGGRQVGLTYTPSGNDRMVPVNRYAQAKGRE